MRFSVYCNLGVSFAVISIVTECRGIFSICGLSAYFRRIYSHIYVWSGLLLHYPFILPVSVFYPSKENVFLLWRFSKVKLLIYLQILYNLFVLLNIFYKSFLKYIRELLTSDYLSLFWVTYVFINLLYNLVSCILNRTVII